MGVVSNGMLSKNTKQLFSCSGVLWTYPVVTKLTVQKPKKDGIAMVVGYHNQHTRDGPERAPSDTAQYIETQ